MHYTLIIPYEVCTVPPPIVFAYVRIQTHARRPAAYLYVAYSSLLPQQFCWFCTAFV